MYSGFFTENRVQYSHAVRVWLFTAKRFLCWPRRLGAPPAVFPRGSFLPLAPMALVIGMCLSLTTAGTLQAQVRLNSADLPEAPAAKPRQQELPQEALQKTPPSPLSTTIDLVSRRSVFFPELAHQPGPLSVQQKAELAADISIAPSRALSSTLTSAIDQARNANPGYGQGWEAYGKRFGSSLATTASANVFGTFVFASAFRQDPRYFAIVNGTFKQKMDNAFRRVVVTRTDGGGQAPNWSGLLGDLVAESLANSYLPGQERTTGKTFRRFGIRVGVGAGVNIFKEYWPSIFKNLKLTRLAPNSST